MSKLNLKDALQSRINHWIAAIRRLETAIIAADKDTPEYHSLSRAQAEYKGRIYAARSFESILGINFDTNYFTNI